MEAKTGPKWNLAFIYFPSLIEIWQTHMRPVEVLESKNGYNEKKEHFI